MFTKFLVIVLIFLVIDIVVSTPQRTIRSRMVTQRQQHKKRDVSELVKLRNDNGEPIYGNGIPGDKAEIISSVYRIAPNDNYYFAYKQSDLQEREEEGIYEFDPIINARKLKVNGFYEYIRPDGKKQRVEYTADDNGFHPNVITE